MYGRAFPEAHLRSKWAQRAQNAPQGHSWRAAARPRAGKMGMAWEKNTPGLVSNKNLTIRKFWFFYPNIFHDITVRVGLPPFSGSRMGHKKT